MCVEQVDEFVFDSFLIRKEADLILQYNEVTIGSENHGPTAAANAVESVLKSDSDGENVAL